MHLQEFAEQVFGAVDGNDAYFFHFSYFILLITLFSVFCFHFLFSCLGTWFMTRSYNGGLEFDSKIGKTARELKKQISCENELYNNLHLDSILPWK